MGKWKLDATATGESPRKAEIVCAFGCVEGLWIFDSPHVFEMLSGKNQPDVSYFETVSYIHCVCL